ncbi:MAG TPA: tRNA (adenosine(37)-N6)-dimethylallyltransferase MiaA [Candidatus Paceibacterota bacterium]
MQKLIVVCGPTATGKSDYAVAIAKKINGEIISADSRQVYKGLDIGSGKITESEMGGIPHHLLDVANPDHPFSVVHYKELADKAVKDIVARGKTPIIVGGTGFYIDAIICDTVFPAVPPNHSLRKELHEKPIEELQEQLHTLDPRRYDLVDKNNRMRLVRAIEIATVLGSVPELQKTTRYDVEWIYLDFPDEVLKERIHTRLMKRIDAGMIEEVAKLHTEGLSWERLESFGLEYRYVAEMLQDKHDMQEMLSMLEGAIWQYVKRQRTWFRKYGK